MDEISTGSTISKDLIKYIPLDKLVLETDAPYLAPVPHRGKQNTPLLIEETYKFIAEVLNISVEELAGIVIKNTKKLFKLG
jgi:TatD DNase family protein